MCNYDDSYLLHWLNAHLSWRVILAIAPCGLKLNVASFMSLISLAMNRRRVASLHESWVFLWRVFWMAPCVGFEDGRRDSIPFDLMHSLSHIDLASPSRTRYESASSLFNILSRPRPRALAASPKSAYIRRTRAVTWRHLVTWSMNASRAPSKGLSALVVGGIDLIGIVSHSVVTDAIVSGWLRSTRLQPPACPGLDLRPGLPRSSGYSTDASQTVLWTDDFSLSMKGTRSRPPARRDWKIDASLSAVGLMS